MSSAVDVNVKLSRLLLLAHKFNNFYLNGEWVPQWNKQDGHIFVTMLGIILDQCKQNGFSKAVATIAFSFLLWRGYFGLYWFKDCLVHNKWVCALLVRCTMSNWWAEKAADYATRVLLKFSAIKHFTERQILKGKVFIFSKLFLLKKNRIIFPEKVDFLC